MELIAEIIKLIQIYYREILGIGFLIFTGILGVRFRKLKQKLLQVEAFFHTLNLSFTDDKLEKDEVEAILNKILAILYE